MTFTENRNCGTCRKCCEGWLTGHLVVEGVVDCTMKRGTPCAKLGPQGCTIYPLRPASPCRSFSCGWLVPNSPLPDDYRPDQLGVIFVPIKWRGKRAWVLVHAGNDPSEDLKAQMRAYSQDTGEPHMVKLPDRVLCYGVPEFQQSMLDLERRGISPWDAGEFT